MPAAAVVGAAVVGSAIASRNSSKAAGKAADAQSEASQYAADAQAAATEKGIAEQRRQFDKMVGILSPYVGAGNQALSQQKSLLGLNGAQMQKQALSAIQSSPYFQTVARQGETSILQNASATGGLRGGNTQAALGQFRPQLLNQLVQQQYQNLGGITSIGQNSAAQTGNAGMQSAGNIGNLYSNLGAGQAAAYNASGQAQAGGILGQANAQNQLVSNLIGIGGAAYGAGAF